MAEVRYTFTRSKEHLDQSDTYDTIQQRLQVQQLIQDATPQQLGHMLEALQAGKMGQIVAN